MKSNSLKLSTLKLTAAMILLAGTASAALAQTYTDPNAESEYQNRVHDYQQQQQTYQDQQQSYDSAAAKAVAGRDTYDVQRERYAHDKAVYEQQRADYDAQYGAGAWERSHGPYRQEADNDRFYGRYRSSPCEQRAAGDAVAGGVIGALAGAAIGSSVAGHHDRGEGAVLGAVAGGAVGADVGASSAHCDGRGYYFSYDQTYPYRVDGDYRSDGRYGYDYYNRRHCRLAVAPAYVDGGVEDRYVRVCPDSYGRYRITP